MQETAAAQGGKTTKMGSNRNSPSPTGDPRKHPSSAFSWVWFFHTGHTCLSSTKPQQPQTGDTTEPRTPATLTCSRGLSQSHLPYLLFKAMRLIGLRAEPTLGQNAHLTTTHQPQGLTVFSEPELLRLFCKNTPLLLRQLCPSVWVICPRLLRHHQAVEWPRGKAGKRSFCIKPATLGGLR